MGRGDVGVWDGHADRGGGYYPHVLTGTVFIALTVDYIAPTTSAYIPILWGSVFTSSFDEHIYLYCALILRLFCIRSI